MKRRTLLASTVALAALSGCFTSEEEQAETTVDEIAEDLDVEDWELEGDTLHVRYETTGSISTDVEWLGSAYADAVDDGLEADLEATATGASNELTITIERELAEEYLEGEIDEEEYFSRIREE